MATTKVDPMEGGAEQEVKYNSIKFGVIGDWFKGTLIGNTRQIPNNLSAKKEMQTIFEFKAFDGYYHNIIKKKVQEEPTIPVKGEVYSFITSKAPMLQQFKNAKLGQIVGLKFKEIKEAKQPGYDDAKIIKVVLFDMDPDYKSEEDMGGY